jgi:ADP-ribosylglycohydrolase
MIIFAGRPKKNLLEVLNMYGAIAGDIIGSVYEGSPVKRKDFKLFHPRMTFTDDTVLTIATAYALMTDRNYGKAYYRFARLYPNAGYGGKFRKWFLSQDPEPYNSFGNGSAMRVSPVARFSRDPEVVIEEAEKTALPTHNHPEGIKGAQAVAVCVRLALNNSSKREIREFIKKRFDYNLDRTLDEIRPFYTFDATCQGSVPEAITAFLESRDYESAVRNAVSLGGDSDTQACIAGAIAEAFYGVPREIKEMVRRILPLDLLETLDRFNGSI